MQVSIRSVQLNKRVRRELGDLAPLMESMKRCGQLNPITISRRFELVAGHRRLESARRLGWQTINATIVDQDAESDRLELELEENLYRKDLTPEELLDGYRRLEKLRRPSRRQRLRAFFARIRDWFRNLFRRRSRKPEVVESGPESPPPAAEARGAAPHADTEEQAERANSEEEERERAPAPD